MPSPPHHAAYPVAAFVPSLPAPPVTLELSPPAPEPWKPSARLIAGLGDAGLLGDWPSTDEVDLSVWKLQPRRKSLNSSELAH